MEEWSGIYKNHTEASIKETKEPTRAPHPWLGLEANPFSTRARHSFPSWVGERQVCGPNPQLGQQIQSHFSRAVFFKLFVLVTPFGLKKKIMTALLEKIATPYVQRHRTWGFNPTGYGTQNFIPLPAVGLLPVSFCPGDPIKPESRPTLRS